MEQGPINFKSIDYDARKREREAEAARDAVKQRRESSVSIPLQIWKIASIIFSLYVGYRLQTYFFENDPVWNTLGDAFASLSSQEGISYIVLCFWYGSCVFVAYAVGFVVTFIVPLSLFAGVSVHGFDKRILLGDFGAWYVDNYSMVTAAAKSIKKNLD